MKKTIKSKLLGLALALGVILPAHPLSESTAKYGALAGGVAAGGLTGLLIHYGFLKNTDYSTTTKLLLTCIPAVALGGLSWYLLDGYLYSLTPRGKYKTIEKIMRWVELDGLTSREFTADEFGSYVTAYFGTSWPLVLARNHLMVVSTNISQVQSLMISIANEISGKTEYADIHEKCDKVKAKLPNISAKIEQYMNYIARHGEYNFQVKLHENHLEEERKRAHTEKLKDKELSHDSWERTQDRWEKGYDRQLKREALNRNDRPIIVSL